MNYANLKATIAANIYQNASQEVSANMVKTAMDAAVDSLGAGYQYLGIATPETNPGTPDARVFYIATTPGDYENFGTGISVADGEVAVLKFDTAWAKEVTGAATAAQVTELGRKVAPSTNQTLSLVVARCAYSSSLQKYISSNTRITTGYITFPQIRTITANAGYSFSVAIFNSILQQISATDFVTSYTIPQAENRYYILVVRKTDNSPILPENLSSAISVDLTDSKFFIVSDMLAFKIAELDSLLYATKNKNLRTSDLQLVNAARGGNGLFVGYAPARICTGFMKFDNPITFTLAAGYEGYFFVHDEDYTLIQFPTAFVSSFQITNTSYLYMVVIRKTTNDTITPEEALSAISGNLSACSFYFYPDLARLIIGTNQQRIKAIESQGEFDSFNLNRNLVDLTDMVWENQNWVYPQAVSYTGIRDALYFTFTNEAGFSGIARYDFNTKEVVKTFLKKGVETNDHNLIAVRMLSTRHLLCAFSGGHNTDKKIFIRIANAKESIENFKDAVVLDCSALTSYAQVFEYDSKLYLFYRLADNNWAYRISEDFGETWGNEVIFITSSIQYYIQLTETTTDGVLRLCCYSNPSFNDSAIRMGYLHLDEMKLYEGDNTTIIGTTNIPQTSIPIIVPVPAGGKVNRLYNAAKTAIGDVKVLYCVFTNAAPGDDGEYYIYDNGVNVKVADAGLGLWIPKTQLGVAWIGTTQIAVGRNAGGSDYLEIYDYSNGNVTFNRLITQHSIYQGYRTGRPMIDDHQRALLYLQGFFNSTTYTDFEMDGKIVELNYTSQGQM